MIPRDLLHQLVQDDAARRDMDLEVRREPERVRRRYVPGNPELPLFLTDAERKRTR